jgi:hypothetical protein
MPTPALRCATLAGAAYLVIACILVTRPEYGDELTTTNYVTASAFLVALLAGAPALLALGATLGDRRAGIVAACGDVVVAIGVTGEVVAGHDLSWFPVPGVLGNVLALVGTILLAVRGRRDGTLPTGLVALLALSVPVGVGLAGIGGSVVPAALWLVVGLRWGRATQPAGRAPAAPSEPAAQHAS